PKGSKIVLLTASDGKGHNNEIKDLFRNVNENREDYCAYHNYTYQFSNITKYQKDGRPAVWGKIPAIIEAFQINPDAEWVWWLDTDAIIMTPALDLASLVLSPEVMQTRITAGKKIRLPNGKTSGYNVSSTIDPSIVDLVVAQDHHGVNAGSFMIRRSEWTAQFLSLWQDPQFMKANYERLEQDALNKIITSNPEMQKHVAFVDLRLINAFSVGADDMGWITGDLVVHFAGCWVTRECDSRWRDFW
ncbi:galactosyl transferase, partial [Myxozyma melibiosi]